MEGYATNFPISQNATQDRGLNYLAIGDWHSFREIPKGAVAPIVYPSTPEPTSFKEQDPGYVAIVTFPQKDRKSKIQIQKEKVARWTWREVAVRSMAELRALSDEDLVSTVLRLKLDLAISLGELKEVEGIISTLAGTAATSARTGAFLCEPSDPSNLVVDPGDIDIAGLPDAVREAATRLKEKNDDLAKRALIILHRLLHEVR
jgi:DNA repair exonuclease SbcCD nuclease subunit